MFVVVVVKFLFFSCRHAWSRKRFLFAFFAFFCLFLSHQIKQKKKKDFVILFHRFFVFPNENDDDDDTTTDFVSF